MKFNLRIEYKGLLITNYIILMILFPLSLLEIFNINEGLKDSMFIFRLLNLGSVFLFFLIRREKIKIPKSVIPFLILICTVILISGVNKFLLDFLILITLTIIYFNFNEDSKFYLNRIMAKYFIFFPIFIALLVFSGVLDKTFYNDGQILYRLGFNNPNYFSLTLLFGFFIAYLNKFNRLMYIALLFIYVTYFFTKTVSVVLLSSALIASIVVFSKRSLLRKIKLISLLIITLLLLVIFVFNPSFLLPSNWEDMYAWQYNSNLFSRIHNNAFKLLEINKEAFWFGGLDSKQDNLFLNYWAALGIIGLWFFIHLSFKAILVKEKISIRISMFIVAIISLGMIEQTVYSMSFVSVLYFSYLFTINKKFYVLNLR